MKRFAIILFAVILCVSSLCAAAEPAVTSDYGNLFELGGLIGAYCNQWDKTIGKSFGSDMYFDVSNLTIIEQTDNGYTVDVDGIVFETDADFNVLAMRVCVTDFNDSYTLLSRVSAIIALLCYDTPVDAYDMTTMFAEIIGKYADSLDFCTDMMKSFDAIGMSDVIEGDKQAHQFAFRYVDDDLYFCVDQTDISANEESAAEKSIRAKLDAAFNGATMPPEEEEYISPMEELSQRMKGTADRRTGDDKVYWKVTVDKLEATYDFSSIEEGAVIVNIDLTWDAMNGVPRAKIMLRMFSDDMAQSIFDAYEDKNITQLWCRWAVPYLVDDDGFIAKYKYEKEDDTVYLTDSNGLLFNMPDDYK